MFIGHFFSFLFVHAHGTFFHGHTQLELFSVLHKVLLISICHLVDIIAFEVFSFCV